MANWEKIKSRGRVDDRRGLSGGGVLGGLSLTTVLLILGANYLMGGSFSDGLSLVEQNTSSGASSNSEQPEEYAGLDKYEEFTSTVVGSANDYWKSVTPSYNEPLLVLFRNQTNSLCGGAYSQIGPHYCPADSTIYLDETFFDDLKNKLGAQGGDVAEAYVIAHEVAHHAQHELGISSELRNLSRKNPKISNEISVSQELQADCFAGLWAHSIKDEGVFEINEITEAMDAASAVGDDRIQERAGLPVDTESWTHGSSEARVSSFMTGYDTGELDECLAITEVYTS